MLQIGLFNALDLFLIFILFLGLLVGFLRGAATQIISAASIWLGLLITLWLYKLLSIHILQGMGFPSSGSDTMAFLILLIVMFHGVRLIVKSLTTAPDTPKKKQKSSVDPLDEAPPSPTQRYLIGPLNTFGGGVMGVILVTLWTSIILGVIQFTTQVDVGNVPGVQVSGTGLANQLRGSTLIHYFNQVLWLLVRSLELFVLDPKADILERVVSKLFERG